MSRSPKELIQEEPYVRTREDPFFSGLLRGDDIRRDSPLVFDLEIKANAPHISRSVSDIGSIRREMLISDVSEKSMDLPLEDATSEIVFKPLGNSTLGKLSKISKTTSFPIPGLHDKLDLMEQPCPKSFEVTEEYNLSPAPVRPTIEKTYSLSKTKFGLPKIPLPQSAASFYNGFLPLVEIVESCEGTKRLNVYLNARRDDVNAGVPGKFLHAVIGQDVPADIGSIASTIMYAFYLNETQNSDHFCTVPVINMKRADLSCHAELKWLLVACQIDEVSLIFIDEIDLSYYDLFGSLKLVLVNGDKLPPKQQALKEAVVEIFNFTKDSSCCTLIAEKFAMSTPELLAGRGFSRVLLAGILFDTGNLTSPHCTIKDKYMATLLINGAGRFGLDGLYNILKYKMYDVSNLKVVDILRKDFKKWTRVGNKPENMNSNVGMSTIGLSIEQLRAHDDTAAQDIRYFQKTEKLRLLVISASYYDSLKNLKREILVSAESKEAMKSLLYFFDSNAAQLGLNVLHQPGLRDDMRVFGINNVTSRRTLECLLEELSRASRG